MTEMYEPCLAPLVLFNSTAEDQIIRFTILIIKIFNGLHRQSQIWEKVRISWEKVRITWEKVRITQENLEVQ